MIFYFLNKSEFKNEVIQKKERLDNSIFNAFTEIIYNYCSEYYSILF